MRRVLAISVLGLVLLGFAMPARASSIVDPIIGVRGGTFGSEPITTTDPLQFGDCPAYEGLDDFTCIAYSITDAYSDGISSITVQISDLDNPDGELAFAQDSNSQFGVQDLGDGLVRLFAFSPVTLEAFVPSFGTLQCPNDGEGTHTCTTGEDLLLYIAPLFATESGHFTSAVVAINDAAPVPEPATLLLMGTGLTALAGRRLRRGKSQQ